MCFHRGILVAITSGVYFLLQQQIIPQVVAFHASSSSTTRIRTSPHHHGGGSLFFTTKSHIVYKNNYHIMKQNNPLYKRRATNNNDDENDIHISMDDDGEGNIMFDDDNEEEGKYSGFNYGEDDDEDGDNDNFYYSSFWENDLPSPLNKYRNEFLKSSIMKFGDNGDDTLQLYVLGTSHVWNQSASDVRLLLETVQPNITFLELDSQRYNTLLAAKKKEEENTGNSDKKVEGNNNNNMGILENTVVEMLERGQKGSAADIGSQVGNEFRTAYEYWKKTKKPQQDNDIPTLPMLVLGDRPLILTWSRCWEALRKRDKAKLALGFLPLKFLAALVLTGGATLALLDSIVESAFVSTVGTSASIIITTLFFLLFQKDDNLDEEFRTLFYKQENKEGSDDNEDEDDLAINWLEQNEFPISDVEDILTSERDIYMACKLYQSIQFLLPSLEEDTSQKQDDENNATGKPKKYKAVAIVGAAHVQGMMEAWESLLSMMEDEFIDFEGILEPLLECKRFQNERSKAELIHDVFCVRE